MGTTVDGTKRAEDLLLGALAVLAIQGHTTLRVTDRSFHDHFGKALEIFRQAGGEIAQLAEEYHRDIVSETYDELDHALIAAEQHRFVGFPNPTYSKLQIKMTRKAAERLLHVWLPAERKVFEAAAQSLRTSIER
jgi:hypothetical protein